MHDFRIVPYSKEDNSAMISIDEKCTQGKSIVLKYRRPSFHARSEVYEKYDILCAKKDNELLGAISWAEKAVKMDGRYIKAAYLYDLRVSPGHRNKGVATCLFSSVMEEISHVDCYYSYIAGENEISVGLSKSRMRTELFVPLTYVIIPVYKRFKTGLDIAYKDAQAIHEGFVQSNKKLEFIPEFNIQKMLGHKLSIAAQENHAGCSIWSNEDLMAEQVVSVSAFYRLIGATGRLLKPFIKFPSFPKPNDTVRSWFLYDFFIDNMSILDDFLKTINNIAYDNNRQYIYLLLQNNNPILGYMKKSSFWIFEFPYFFTAGGRVLPNEIDNIYHDIRDL